MKGLRGLDRKRSIGVSWMNKRPYEEMTSRGLLKLKKMSGLPERLLN
jgi:hypothetical protein